MNLSRPINIPRATVNAKWLSTLVLGLLMATAWSNPGRTLVLGLLAVGYAGEEALTAFRRRRFRFGPLWWNIRLLAYIATGYFGGLCVPPGDHDGVRQGPFWLQASLGALGLMSGLLLCFLAIALELDASLRAGILSPPLLLPPGVKLRHRLAFIYSAKTMERIVEPILADIQAEWTDATIANRSLHARWIQVRGYWHLGQHLGLLFFVRFVKVLLELFVTL
jgi:hypothetical protein